MRKCIGLLLALAFAALPGCTTAPSRPEGTAWRLAGWSVSSQRADEHAITARFADGGISGRSAVNTYRGSATFGGNDTLVIGPVATTRMAGPEPAMRAEGHYLGLLARVGAYRLGDARLTLLDGNGNELLVFEAVGD
jgi:heat shock protein HslJ